jgi:hypothetical protein
MFNIQKMKWIILPVCLLFVIGLAQQTTATQQSQTNTQAESKSFVYQNIRITVTRRGVVAGDLRTGKVIWRRGFWENPRHILILNSVQFFGEYLFYRTELDQRAIWGGLLYSVTGNTAVDAMDFYIKEADIFYFDDTSFPENMADRIFADIVIKIFNSKTKAIKYFTLMPDKYLDRIDRYCYLPQTSIKLFAYTEKRENIWNFTFSDKKCEIKLSFDYANTNNFSIIVKRKNK